MPPIGYFALGFGVAVAVVPFFQHFLSNRWSIVAFTLGLLAITPSLLVIIDNALGIWIPGHSVHIVFALYFKIISLPVLKNLLYAFLPAVSGALMHLGFNAESKHKYQLK